MTEAVQSKGTQKAAPIVEDKSFIDLLKTLVGQVVTMVNPESYEDAPVGHQIRAGFYRAKIMGTGNDYMIVATEFQHAGKSTGKEAVRQYIPFTRIKRISLMKGERLIHI